MIEADLAMKLLARLQQVPNPHAAGGVQAASGRRKDEGGGQK
jgi:hypothetical protein